MVDGGRYGVGKGGWGIGITHCKIYTRLRMYDVLVIIQLGLLTLLKSIDKQVVTDTKTTKT